jgi:hypothetical protein
MRSRSGDFVRKTVSLDSDIRPLLDKISAKKARKAVSAIFISRIINDILRTTNFKNLEKYSVNPRGVGKRSRITIVVDIDIHRKIVEYTAAAIEECAINYCGEPSQSYSKVLNNALRKGLNI